MPDVALTWLGHGSYRIDSPGGKRIYFDPWLENPKCPDAEREPKRVDVMAISHGHGDHIGSAVAVGRRFSPAVVAVFELSGVTLTRDSSALAHVSIQPLGGKLRQLRAKDGLSAKGKP